MASGEIVPAMWKVTFMRLKIPATWVERNSSRNVSGSFRPALTARLKADEHTENSRDQ
jgi:hypothetical protein